MSDQTYNQPVPHDMLIRYIIFVGAMILVVIFFVWLFIIRPHNNATDSNGKPGSSSSSVNNSSAENGTSNNGTEPSSGSNSQNAGQQKSNSSNSESSAASANSGQAGSSSAAANQGSTTAPSTNHITANGSDATATPNPSTTASGTHAGGSTTLTNTGPGNTAFVVFLVGAFAALLRYVTYRPNNS